DSIITRLIRVECRKKVAKKSHGLLPLMPPTEGDGERPHDLVAMAVQRRSVDADLLGNRPIAGLIRVEILTLHDLSLHVRQRLHSRLDHRHLIPRPCDLCLAPKEMDCKS